jgi:spore coat polysaccharide biosynthesis protein SpsF (cytidylyltransferase family)
MSHTGIVIQARMGSTRLPGKVLADLGGRPMLARQVERLRLVPGVDRIVVATSDTTIDDPVAALVQSLDGVDLWRGSEDDVLARFAGVAAAFDLDVIGRVTGDCPLIDPVVIGKVLSVFNATAGCDYSSNCRPRTWPSGFDVEFVSRRALDAADAEATDPFDRQHVLVYVFTHPERFRCVNVENDGPGSPDLRLTVDYREDLDFVRTLFEALAPHWPTFGLAELLDVLKSRPSLLQINAAVPAHESITDASQRGVASRR